MLALLTAALVAAAPQATRAEVTYAKRDPAPAPGKAKAPSHRSESLVITLETLLKLPGAPLDKVAALTGADPANREEVTHYQALHDLEVIPTPGKAWIYVRGDAVKVIYFGELALPRGLRSDTLRDALGSDGEELRSRQGKRATLHVVAERGVAWSEEDGNVGFVEVFPPTTLDAYRTEIYGKSPRFLR
jgi:hypothetical protein